MELEHEKLTQGEAAQKLLVKVDERNWVAERLAIVRREESGKHWVHMVICDPDNPCEKMEFFALRPAMIECWMALQIGEKKIDQLKVEINNVPDTVIDVAQTDIDMHSWISVTLLKKDVTIAIERQSMINAYYALRTNIEDFFEAGTAVMKGIFKML